MDSKGNRDKEASLLTPQAVPPHTTTTTRPSLSRLSTLLSLSLAGALLLQLLQPTSTNDDILIRNPTSSLRWKHCEDNSRFLCSRLVVPLNWVDPVEGENAEVFLKLLPSGKKGKDRKGTMLINPGGPGGSGTFFVERTGPSLSTILDDAYDILGFDPRGVNLTTPQINAFDSEYDYSVFTTPNAFALSHAATAPLNLSDPVDYANDERQVVKSLKLAQLISAKLNAKTTEQARKSVSTAFVVRDMVAILDALGEGEEDLVYWGFSYGTILGATFAAMMPDRVGRLVLDGVSHSGDYTSSMLDWGRSSMTDSRATLLEFYRLCASSGPSRCALAPPLSEGSEEERADIVKSKVEDLLDSLWDEPIVVLDGKDGQEGGIITQTGLHQVIFRMLYAPITWSEVASSIALALPPTSNATALLSRVRQASRTISTSKGPQTYHGQTVGDGNEAQIAILCGDSGPANEMSVDEWVQLGDEMRSRSLIGEAWREIMIPCASFLDRPYERYSGPWTTSSGLRKTKNKVLFVGNTWDPVTPLASAMRMAEGFSEASASLLVHNGTGHCTSAHPSLCTGKAIREYLVNGVVPLYGTTCQPEDGFVFPDKTNASVKVMSQEDDKLLKAIHALAMEKSDRFE